MLFAAFLQVSQSSRCRSAVNSLNQEKNAVLFHNPEEFFHLVDQLAEEGEASFHGIAVVISTPAIFSRLIGSVLLPPERKRL